MSFSLSNNIIRPIANFLENHPNAGIIATTLPMLALDGRIAIAAKAIELGARMGLHYFNSQGLPHQASIAATSVLLAFLKDSVSRFPGKAGCSIFLAGGVGFLTESTARYFIQERQDANAGLRTRATFAGLTGLAVLSEGASLRTAALLGSIVFPTSCFVIDSVVQTLTQFINANLE